MTTRSRGATAAVAGSAVAAVAVAALAFWLSFAALADLAARFGVPAGQAWAFPLVVDGLVVVSTVAAAAMTRHRWYAWALLVVGTIVSVAGNGIHAWHLTASQIGVGIAVIPPLGTLAAIHLTIMLAQQGRDSITADPELATTVDTGTKHDDVADRDEAPEPAPAPVRRLRAAPATASRLAATPGDAAAACATQPTLTPEVATTAVKDTELRERALRLVAEGMSRRATAAQLGVSKDKVQRWVAERATATSATAAV